MRGTHREARTQRLRSGCCNRPLPERERRRSHKRFVEILGLGVLGRRPDNCWHLVHQQFGLTPSSTRARCGADGFPAAACNSTTPAATHLPGFTGSRTHEKSSPSTSPTAESVPVCLRTGFESPSPPYRAPPEIRPARIKVHRPTAILDPLPRPRLEPLRSRGTLRRLPPAPMEPKVTEPPPPDSNRFSSPT